jgi:hypothetical protein
VSFLLSPFPLTPSPNTHNLSHYYYYYLYIVYQLFLGGKALGRVYDQCMINVRSIELLKSIDHYNLGSINQDLISRVNSGKEYKKHKNIGKFV